MHIGAIMQEKGGVVHSTTPDRRLQDAVEAMLALKVSCLVVLSTSGNLMGIVTERDIVRTLKERPDDWKDALVDEVMSRRLYTADLDAPMDLVIRDMRDRHIRHLPVVVEGNLVGVLSIRDLIAATMSELERHNQMLKRYISEWPPEGAPAA